MRVATQTQLLEAKPGDSASLRLDVINTGGVIDGVSARVIGLPEHSVRTDPELLSLFPDSSGQLLVSLDVPRTQPAGRHPLTVEIVSHGARLPSEFVDLDLEISARPDLRMAARPRTVRARREGRFTLELANTGNVALHVRPEAADADRVVRTTFSPTELRLEPGTVAPILLTVDGPRIVVGSEIDRVVTIRSVASRVLTPSLADDDELAPALPTGEELSLETTVRLRQRPLLSRGLLTALILAGIITLWATIFILSLTGLFNRDPLTKTAPASFFAATPSKDAQQGGQQGGQRGGQQGGQQGGSGGADCDGGAADDQTGEGAAPADAPAKGDGRLPLDVGGSLAGTVRAVSNGKGVPNVVVTAYRPDLSDSVTPSSKDPLCPNPAGWKRVASSATQSDGTYNLAGLFPGDYLVQYCAPGFPVRYAPNAKTPRAAEPLAVTAQRIASVPDLAAKGRNGTISGSIDPGDDKHEPATAIKVTGLDTALSRTVDVTKNAFEVKGLPAPATYQLTYTTRGATYRATAAVVSVAAGQHVKQPQVRLAASAGQITGTVRDGDQQPVGGVTVTASVAGKPITVSTPTVGVVGAFRLVNLPTPATYVITFSKAGFGSTTKVYDLAAGQSKNVDVPLAAGVGSISGQLSAVDSRGQSKGLGGATVTVGGTLQTAADGDPTDQQGNDPALTTTTLTQGAEGQFVVNGLTAPGSYTVSFTLEGYTPVTVPVNLDGKGKAKADATMTRVGGAIKGRVVDENGARVSGATITVTDGRLTWTTTSTLNGAADQLPDGGYLISGLVPGHYAVTATQTGRQPQTRLVEIRRDETRSADLTLRPEGG